MKQRVVYVTNIQISFTLTPLNIIYICWKRNLGRREGCSLCITKQYRIFLLFTVVTCSSESDIHSVVKGRVKTVL